MKIAKLSICAVLIAAFGVAPQFVFAQTVTPSKQEDANERVTLNFRESSIQQVFELLSRKDKVNIILGKGVTGMVSVNLYNVTVREAIFRVAEAAGYGKTGGRRPA